MFCTNCGNTLMEGALFCTQCGAKVESQAPVDPGFTQEQNFNQPNFSQPNFNQPNYGQQMNYDPNMMYGQFPQENSEIAPVKKSKTGLIIGIVAGGIVLVAAIVVVVLFATGLIGGDKDSSSKKSKADTEESESESSRRKHSDTEDEESEETEVVEDTEDSEEVEVIVGNGSGLTLNPDSIADNLNGESYVYTDNGYSGNTYSAGGCTIRYTSDDTNWYVEADEDALSLGIIYYGDEISYLYYNQESMEETGYASIEEMLLDYDGLDEDSLDTMVMGEVTINGYSGYYISEQETDSEGAVECADIILIPNGSNIDFFMIVTDDMTSSSYSEIFEMLATYTQE